MDIFIPLMLFLVVIVGGALFFEFGYPRIKHRRQLERIRANGSHRILTADERNALSRYLSLSPTQYRQLLGSYLYRNDGWAGDWSPLDDNVYGAHVIFEVKCIERLFIQNRFCQAGALRFNILPFWEKLEGCECTIEFVLTDKIPVVVSINNHSLREGMLLVEHFLDSETAVDDFNRHHGSVGRSSTGTEQTASPDKKEEEEEEQTPTFVPVEGTYLPAGTDDDDDSEPSSSRDYADNSSKESHSAYPLIDVEEADIIEETAAEEGNQQTGKAEDAPHAQHSTQHENARLGNEHAGHDEHDISGVAVINVRNMSTEEAKHYYGPKFHRILGSLALIFCALLTWSGGSTSDAQDALSLVFGLVLIGIMVCWAALPFWMPLTQIKTVQGPLVLGYFHAIFPTMRSLGIGNLRINLPKTDLLSDDDIGRVINVDLTPKRDVIAIDGTSIYTGAPYSIFNSPKFFFATLLALCAVLFCNSSLINITRYLREGIQGPHHVTLSTLESTEHYKPVAGDILEITNLPVLCELDRHASPDCHHLRPGLPSAIDLSVDRTRYQALAKIEQRYSHIHEKMTNDLHYNYAHSSSTSSGIEPSYDYVIPDAKTLLNALTFFKKEMDPEEYEIVTTMLSSRIYSHPVDRQHPNDIVLKDDFGSVTKLIIGNLLEHEDDNNQQRIQSMLKALPASKTPWVINAINDDEQDSSAMRSFQNGRDVLHMSPAFNVPEKTGYERWDRQVERLANDMSGHLTVRGQVTDVKRDAITRFELQRHYHEPSALWRIISLITLAMLVAAACGTAICATRTQAFKALL